MVGTQRDRPARLDRRAQRGVTAAQFAEVVSSAVREGPQRFVGPGGREVVLIAERDYQALKPDRTGKLLVEALCASPCKEWELEPARMAMPVR
jgi:hypothetical protein